MFREETVERRSKPRIQGPIPAMVRGSDTNGESFEIETALDNLSVGGLYVCLQRRLDVAAPLFALIRFAGMEIEATGVVKRVESQPNGSFGFGVALEDYNITSIQ